MDDRVEEKPEDKINAGRGVVKSRNENSKKNTTLDQQDDADDLDDRARKAGY